MKLKAILLGSILLASPLHQAFADTCSANIFGGYDCRYDNGTTSTSRANIFGGQDTQNNDGSSSTSRSNIFGGQDTNHQK
ncbi:hypothetical protein K5D36_24130 [Pseudomonas cichorii]|nr:hypothetical protein [Pseudomonas cichorii]